MSADVHSDTLVAAPAARIMAVVLDVEAYPQWQPEIKRAEVLERDAQQRPTRARMTVDAKVLTVTYTLGYDHHPDRVAWRLVEGDQLDELTGSYALREHGDRTTTVVYELTVALKVPVPRLLRRQAAGRIAEGALQGLRARVEAQG